MKKIFNLSSFFSLLHAIFDVPLFADSVEELITLAKENNPKQIFLRLYIDENIDDELLDGEYEYYYNVRIWFEREKTSCVIYEEKCYERQSTTLYMMSSSDKMLKSEQEQEEIARILAILHLEKKINELKSALSGVNILALDVNDEPIPGPIFKTARKAASLRDLKVA